MTEKQHINQKDVWLLVKPLHVKRDNPNIIPTEYFTVSYCLYEPTDENTGEILKDENGESKLFESPVAALSYAAKKLQEIL
jgi:hypothetical protein